MSCVSSYQAYKFPFSTDSQFCEASCSSKNAQECKCLIVASIHSFVQFNCHQISFTILKRLKLSAQVNCCLELRWVDAFVEHCKRHIVLQSVIAAEFTVYVC